MKIHALFVSYSGGDTDLELADAWDEYAIDANPEGFLEACRKLSTDSDVERWVEVVLEVSEQAVRAALHPAIVVLPAAVVTDARTDLKEKQQ